MYRLEGEKWKKLGEKNWISRFGHSCQLLDGERLVVIGGDFFEKSVDILDLNSNSWSKVNINFISIKRINRITGSQSSCRNVR